MIEHTEPGVRDVAGDVRRARWDDPRRTVLTGEQDARPSRPYRYRQSSTVWARRIMSRIAEQYREADRVEEQRRAETRRAAASARRVARYRAQVAAYESARLQRMGAPVRHRVETTAHNPAFPETDVRTGGAGQIGKVDQIEPSATPNRYRSVSPDALRPPWI